MIGRAVAPFLGEGARRKLLTFVLSIVIILTAASSNAETIQLERQSGTYMVPVRINDAITLPFVLDTGASSVAIPSDVFLTLLRTGTVKNTDFIGTATYVLADGSRQQSNQFLL